MLGSYLSTFLDSFLSKEICYDLISELERPYLSSKKEAFVAMKKCIRLPKSEYNVVAWCREPVHFFVEPFFFLGSNESILSLLRGPFFNKRLSLGYR